MPKGPRGGPRPFAKGEIVVFLPLEVSESSDIDRVADQNQDRLESKLAFNIEEQLSDEFRQFGVDRVLIMFSNNRVAFRIETGEDRVTGDDFYSMMEEVKDLLTEEGKQMGGRLNLNMGLATEEWWMGTGRSGLFE